MMLQPGEWEAYAADGTVYNSLDYEPNDIPVFGIVGIVQNTNGHHYDLLATGEKWYVFWCHLGYWMEHDDEGLYDNLYQNPCHLGALRLGRQMLLKDFKAIKNAMQQRIDQHQVTVR